MNIRNHLDRLPHIDYRRHPAYGGAYEAPSWADRRAAVAKLWPSLRQLARDQAKLGWYRARSAVSVAQRGRRPPDPMTDGLGQRLRQEGAVAIMLPPGAIGALDGITTDFFARLAERRATVPGDKRTTSDNTLEIRKQEAPDAFGAVLAIFRDAGVLQVADDYLRIPYSCRLKIQINSADDRFLYDRLARTGRRFVTDPRTNYMHVDSNIYPVLKCVIYLDEVTLENGPFSYVIGSNRLRSSALERVIRKSVHKSGLQQSHDPEARRLFSALPGWLQKKAEFGVDLADDAPEAELLLRAERRFTSDLGNLVIFDPDGIHRGGLVRQGVRRAVFANFQGIPA